MRLPVDQLGFKKTVQKLEDQPLIAIRIRAANRQFTDPLDQRLAFVGALRE